MKPAFAQPLALLLLPLAAIALRKISGPLSGKPRKLLRMRLAAVALLCAALAGPSVTVEREGTSTALLVDRSRSCVIDEAALERALRAARESMGPEDDLRVLAFAGGVSASPDRSLLVPPDPLGRDRTDLGRALRTALAYLDPERARRIVVVSDGEDTVGRLRDALSAALLAGVPVHAVASLPRPAADLVARRLDLRERVKVGEPVAALLDLVSPSTLEIRVVVSVDGVPRFEYPLATPPGFHRHPLPVTFDRPGFARVEAEVFARADPEPRNNRVHGFIEVGDAARLLYVTDRADPPALRLLEASGMPVRRAAPAAVPGNAQELSAFGAVALDNVPAAALSGGFVRALVESCREAGTGIVVFGGDRSFGQGGWRDSPLEQVLPLASDLLNDSLLKKVALVFLLDKSGSMEGRTLETAKAALVESGRALQPHDAVGIVAFDSEARVALPLTAGRKDGHLIDTLLDVGSGGGTDFLPALEAALEMLAPSPAEEKHAILLSDGQPNSADFDAILAKFRAAKVTLSTVAVGAGTDDTLMRSISARGNGRFHKAEDLSEVPRIFLGEVKEFKRSYLAVGTFPIVPRGLSAALASLPAEAAVDGYVRTVLQPGAELLATVGEDEPLLAARRAGLGRTVAFAADSGGRFSAPLARAEGFSEFVRLLVESVLRDPESDAAGIAVEDSDEGVAVTCPASAATLRVTPPSGEPFAVPVSPGGLARFVPEREGVHLLVARDALDRPVARRGYVNPYSREYRRFGVNRARLSEIAAFTGGRSLPNAGLAALLASPEGGARRPLPLAPHLLLLAALLFLLEIFARRFGGGATRGTYAAAPAPPAEPPEPAAPPEDPMAALTRRRRDKFVRIDK